jgi:uncharacterized coiled-coil DUF342 family protein
MSFFFFSVRCVCWTSVLIGTSALVSCAPAVNDAEVKDLELQAEKARAELVTLHAKHDVLQKEMASLQQYKGEKADEALRTGESLLEERDALLALRKEVQERVARLKAGREAHRQTLESGNAN